eukprot:gnl/Spiro4/17320_TR9225_c0_g1_i1.p1 gnl/Spiro4/17320_TR9225_c0_g1~~gnl/Spiro4/17320_TR9225_c0_g1_i1.p1  ORF type:complete len:198 (+),score=55.98 gnl/Spiro4/17320_TR9225_c0_g1_i1:35-595(+)
MEVSEEKRKKTRRSKKRAKKKKACLTDGTAVMCSEPPRKKLRSTRAELLAEEGLPAFPLTKSGQVPKGVRVEDYRPPAPYNTTSYIVSEHPCDKPASSRDRADDLLPDGMSDVFGSNFGLFEPLDGNDTFDYKALRLAAESPMGAGASHGDEALQHHLQQQSELINSLRAENEELRKQISELEVFE